MPHYAINSGRVAEIAACSALPKVIEALVGSDNASALSLGQLGERFAVAKLQGSLVNLCPEIPRGAAMPDSIIKAISSGDVIAAEFKGRDHFEFRPRATLWFATNTLPSPRDMSPALVEKRARLIALNNTFKDEARDPLLAEKLLAELPGILAICLDWFAQCFEVARAPGGWTTNEAGRTVPLPGHGYGRDLIEDPASSKQAKSAWRMDTDPVRLYADERLVSSTGPDSFIPSDELLKDWQAWAEANGVSRAFSAQQLTLALKNIFPAIKTGEKRNRKRGIVGLALVD